MWEYREIAAKAHLKNVFGVFGITEVKVLAMGEAEAQMAAMT